MTDIELLKLYEETNNNIEESEIIIQESLKLLDRIYYEVEHFDHEEEYDKVYKRFRESINEKYVAIFPDILDFSARIIIHEIYLLHDNPIDIDIEFQPIQKASSVKRKHFTIAKDIAIRTLKTYYYSKCSKKRIIDYIDEYLPEEYTKPRDIDFVVWYFLICIVTYNKKIK